jgi:Rieske Fe-S protein
MAAGLAGGYGLFAWVSARFMLPARRGQMEEQFVGRARDLAVGASTLYQTPDGHTVNITRRGAEGTVADFIALSSTCPHLGCQVRWEGQNNRYFCPCHSGTFDPEGKATGGPPGDAGLSLPRYLLTLRNGLLYVSVPVERLAVPRQARAGHDPCLACGRARSHAPSGERRA